MNASNAKHAEPGFFDRRAAKKDADRMAEYRDPEYAKGMDQLFGGAVKPPERGRLRF
ncbi:hypothetical protein [Marinobacter goseongensis]|uniref:hypothetical protein n=1 Tax=Marinobacter goseongensis TaxID=453838 RepID=UPI0020051038|nr:hypothetical protein [Marinobacter goseongensis]MCK7552785.1 hypothetical protein [Marinobacter goseongensis]